jgi:glycosyltransferase involved in cell wall biosynthesis
MITANKENTAIIIPAYNSENHLEDLLERIYPYSEKKNIFVVNDASTDNTSEICQKQQITCIDFPVNCGKGFALQKGFKAALNNGYFYALTIDSDLQHPPENIPDFWQKQAESKAELIIGKRDFSFKKMPFMRICSNTITSFILTTFTRKKIEDSQCGFRLYQLSVLGDMKFVSRRYQFETEIIIKLARFGGNIYFTPIPTIYQGEKSYISHARDIWHFIEIVLYEILQNWRHK